MYLASPTEIRRQMRLAHKIAHFVVVQCKIWIKISNRSKNKTNVAQFNLIQKSRKKWHLSLNWSHLYGWWNLLRPHWRVWWKSRRANHPLLSNCQVSPHQCENKVVRNRQHRHQSLKWPSKTILTSSLTQKTIRRITWMSWHAKTLIS